MSIQIGLAKGAMGMFVVAVIQILAFGQAPSSCDTCGGSAADPVAGSIVGNCSQPETTEIIGFEGPHSLYKLINPTLHCSLDTPDGPMNCPVFLCCGDGRTGWFGCTQEYDLKCQPEREKCAGKCCATGAFYDYIAIKDCPGDEHRRFECNPIP